VRRFEYMVIDTERDIEAQFNELGAEGWQVVGVTTTKKQMLIAPPAALILMRELEPAAAKAA
jgi:hypothetical protein